MTARVDSCLASSRSSQNASSLVFLFRPATNRWVQHVRAIGERQCRVRRVPEMDTSRQAGGRPRSQGCSAGAPFAHQHAWLHTCTPLPHTHSTAGSSGYRRPCKSRCRCCHRRHRRSSWATSSCRRGPRCTQCKWQGRGVVSGTQHRGWLLLLSHQSSCLRLHTSLNRHTAGHTGLHTHWQSPEGHSGTLASQTTLWQIRLQEQLAWGRGAWRSRHHDPWGACAGGHQGSEFFGNSAGVLFTSLGNA